MSIQKISDILYKIIFDQTIYMTIQSEALRVIRTLIEDVVSPKVHDPETKSIKKFLTKSLEKHVQKLKQVRNNLKRIEEYIDQYPEKGSKLLSPKFSSLPKKVGKT